MSNSNHSIPPLKFEMLSQPRYLSAIRAMVGNVAQRFGFTETECSQIALAVDEAICNIISHGYDKREDGHITVAVWPEESPAGLRLVIEDNARQVDPESIKSRDLDDIRPGGLGVHIIREVMDEAVYERRAQGGMRLTLVKRIKSGRLAPAESCANDGGCCS
jgi:anti-sigma regulatory factor (Ser/Thr protein kinase)